MKFSLYKTDIFNKIKEINNNIDNNIRQELLKNFLNDLVKLSETYNLFASSEIDDELNNDEFNKKEWESKNTFEIFVSIPYALYQKDMNGLFIECYNLENDLRLIRDKNSKEYQKKHNKLKEKRKEMFSPHEVFDDIKEEIKTTLVDFAIYLEKIDEKIVSHDDFYNYIKNIDLLNLFEIDDDIKTIDTNSVEKYYKTFIIDYLKTKSKPDLENNIYILFESCFSNFSKYIKEV